MTYAVGNSPDFRRIKALPRRTWDDARGRAAAEVLTERFRAEGGTMTLRPIQAIALIEAGRQGGGLFPLRVGAGKSLLSLLLPRMFPNALRPLLLIPAALRKKTKKEAREYREHFVLPAFLKVESYQTLSTKRMATWLDEYQPDLIIADECHFLRNRSAAVTKRVTRYLKAAGDRCAFVGMSGTITKRSIRDFAHLAYAALGENAPVPGPDNFHVVEEWSRALDVNVADHRRMAPGVLEDFGTPARVGYRRRFVETPGIVATQDPPLPIEVKVRGIQIPSPDSFDEHWDRLREEWMTPDGWECQDPIEIWRHARELAFGMYYRWDPRPPPEWMGARSEYGSIVREILKTNRRHLDTELQARHAIPEHYPWAEDALRRWEAIAPTFTPNVDHVWLSDHAVKRIEQWAAEAPGIVWVDHIALGRKLDLPYYAGDGMTEDGRYIEDHDPERDGSCVASIAANGTGRNLQRWNRNLIAGLPSTGERWEQLLGRTVRPGQKSACVTFDIVLACLEDAKGFAKVIADTVYAEEITGQAQILTHADIEDMPLPEEIERSKGQWASNRG